jgi:hypothetical protein
MPTKPLKYKFETAAEQHLEGIIDVFAEAFCTAEPMTQYLKIDQKRFKVFARAVAENAIQDKLSIVALDKDKVVACALVEDMAAIRDAPLDFHPDFKYIAALLEQLGASYFAEKVFKIQCVAHLFITAVATNYRRQGLSTAVNLRATALAGLRGFKFIYSELTNVYNELGIFHHIQKNRQLTGTCTYKEFEVGGIKPFAALSGSANGYIWEIHPHTDFNILNPKESS